jgi:TonB family protein
VNNYRNWQRCNQAQESGPCFWHPTRLKLSVMHRIAIWCSLVLAAAFTGFALHAQAPTSETRGPGAFLKLLDSQHDDVSVSLPLPAGAYRVADGISAPEISERTEPEYPAEAQQIGLEGSALIAAVVEENGSLSHIQVTRPLGFGLDERALEAVSKWKFKPGAYKGYPISTFTSFAVDFRIPHDPSRWHVLGLRFSADKGITPPVLKTTALPHGAGIANESLDEGQLVVASGRLTTVTLLLRVDKSGVPVDFTVENASEPLWGKEAIGVVRSWRFRPAMENGKPVNTPVEVDLAWGPRDLPRGEQSVRSSGATSVSASLLSFHPPVVSRVEPVYSFEALARNIEGSALISMTVDEDGVPRDLKAQWSPGYGLDQKAIEAVSQWRFRPVVSGGKAVAVPAEVSVSFTLPESFGNVVKPKTRPYKPMLILP